MYKVALFDFDGVLNRQPEYWPLKYMHDNNYSEAALTDFFKTDFQQALTGRADLKELIIKRQDVWHYDGDPQELIDQWFEYENYPDVQLLTMIDGYRKRGLLVYVATLQEKYRERYIRDKVLTGLVDGVYASASVGYRKIDQEYFEAILTDIQQQRLDIDATSIIYFDDNEEGLTTAARLGIHTVLYTSINQVTEKLG